MCQCNFSLAFSYRVTAFTNSNTTQLFLDGRRCIACVSGGCGPCPGGQVRIERDPSGKILDRVECVQCAQGTVPDTRGTRCVPCYNWPLEDGDKGRPLNKEARCDCVLKAGLCLPDNLDNQDVYRVTSSTFQIPYSKSSSDSVYFRRYFEYAVLSFRLY